MALNQIPTFDQVKDWVNNNFNYYTDTDTVSAVNNESSLSVDISGNSDTVDGYDIQKNGTDGTGIINFKT